MTAPGTPPPDHRIGRQDRLLLFLRVATALTVAGALIGVLAPGGAGRAAANAVIALLIAVPLLRVVWLIQRWMRKGDRRFALVAACLLAIVGLAPFMG
jgi:hypothetical protein